MANGVFCALTPSVGIQSLAILGTWFVARTALKRESSLIQAYIWAWINNPLTMIPMYYVFYLTGSWLIGHADGVHDYSAFAAVWDASSDVPWLDRIATLGREVGLPTALGSLPYATVGAILSYRWAVRALRARRVAKVPEVPGVP